MTAIEKFQELLKKLFQFEWADLDFGIYRILNYKRRQIEKFIDEDLKNKVESAFAKHKDERLENIKQKFEEIKKELKETAEKLGQDPFTPTGELKEEFKNSELGKKYENLKAQKDEAEAIDEIKDNVFNDLYNFFSRYYEEGDFVPQYRYSIKGHKYAIPYNGEEVKLYWANHDQYYIKTGLLFRDYTFKAENYKIIFRTVSAKEELGSNKATKQRFFILDDENPVEKKDREIIIRFQYRELLEGEEILETEASATNGEEGDEENKKKSKIKQENLNQIIKEKIINGIEDINIKNLLSKEYKKDAKGNPISLLDYHLNRFTAKNTKDYFIHKNLKKFLSEQLDYFIKSEVLDIETIEKERFLDKHITRAKVVREIGKTIIDFLSQIEDFQKRLWEKKKFVIKTEYVITTDRIPEEFYDEIWEKEEQKKEWEELGFEIPNKKEELGNYKLPIDTKYFSSEFKEKLLEKLTEEKDLDDLLDGLLIKSENWQALNLLLNKYKGTIKTIYIDPPYNTGSDEFLYRDRYQHSSWLSMMENRLSLARELMGDDGVIFVSIGDLNPQDGESFKLQLLESSIFSRRFGNLIWKKRGGIGSFSEKNMTENHEYITVYGNQKSFIYHNILSESKRKEYKYEDKRGLFRWMDLVGPSQQTKEKRPNLNYGIIYDETADKIIGFEYFKNNKKEKDIFDECEEGHEIVSIWLPGKATWLISKEVLKEYYKRGLIKVFKSGGNYKVKIKNYLYNESGILKGDILKSILTDNDLKIGMNIEATKELQSLFPEKENIIDSLNPKPVSLVKVLIYVTTINKEIILDFFAGSGTTAHAVMKLNKEDGGKRKFILVEMADYFDTIIIPRIKKVAYSFNWKDGKPQDKDGISVFFKYQYLEQYEDTLDNIELKEDQKAQELFKDEYLIKYFLDFETKDSPYLLNIENLKNPFNYRLKFNLQEVGEPKEVIVDIPETFNYLLGIKLKKIKKRKNNNKDYLFILGEKEGQKYAIVWRELSDNKEEAEKDKEFIKKELEDWRPQVVYVNCPNNTVLTPDFGDFQVEIRYIEPEFKKLMEQ